MEKDSTETSGVIADWHCDYIGLGLAEMLAKDGYDVRLAVDRIHAGQNLQIYLHDYWMGKHHSLRVKIIPYACFFGADGCTAYFYHTTSGEPIICKDIKTLVLALEDQPVTLPENSLKEVNTEFIWLVIA